MEKYYVALIQTGFFSYGNISYYREKVSSLIREAKEREAKLILFPEYFGQIFLGRGDLTAVLRSELDFFLQFFADQARKNNVYILPGSIVQKNFITAYLINDQGELAGVQNKLHLTKMEKLSEMKIGSELNVYKTALGSMGILNGIDAYFPEVSRILALKGVKILLNPMAFFSPYLEKRQLAGLWREVQQNQVFGLTCCLIGNFGGKEWQGKSTIYGPCEMTEGESGLIAEAKSFEKEEIVMAEIDFNSLQKTVDDCPIYKFLNPGMYEQYFPQIYGFINE